MHTAEKWAKKDKGKKKRILRIIRVQSRRVRTVSVLTKERRDLMACRTRTTVRGCHGQRRQSLIYARLYLELYSKSMKNLLKI